MDIRQSDPDLESIARRLLNGEIELQPDFQRQEVWSRSKKQKLIDTILRGWAIPPVHLVQNDLLEDVLDGQQRLTAIRDFVVGNFPINGFVAPENEDIISLNGIHYENLPFQIRRKFDRYTLRVYTLRDAHPQETAELFYRLNQPTALTSGEQRNALYGIRRTQMKRLVSKMDSLGYDLKTIGFSNSRLAYDDVVARTLVVFERGGLREKIGESEISASFRNEVPFDLHLTESISKAMEFISAAFDRGQLKLNKASLFSFLVAFSRHREFLPEQYARTITSLLKGGSSHDQDHAGHHVYRDIFLDRVSSRVTDASSVILRDFCIVRTLDMAVKGRISDNNPLLYMIDRTINETNTNQPLDVAGISKAVISSNWGASL